MRVSTSYFSQRGLASMLEQQKRLSDIQQQIASGKRLLRPSDDPTGAAQILRLEQAVASTAQYQRNSDAALNRLTLEEATLKSVEDSLLRIRELALQASNGTLSYSDRYALAQEVRERLNELVSYGNTRDANQEYLFAGNKVTTKPFAQTANGSFVYSGDQGQRALQISSGRQIADSDSGNSVFVNIKNGNGIFQINETASNTLVPGIYTPAVSDGSNLSATENTVTAIGGAEGIGGPSATENTFTAIAGTEGIGGASATENTVTAIAGTDGGAGGEQFILTIDGVGAVDVTFGAGETVATGAIAAELDSDLATFIAGSGGAYSIVSGSLSGGDLVLSKADGTAITFDTSTSTLTGVAASVTESETTAGTIAERFVLSIDGVGAVDVSFAAGNTIATPAIAAELDSDLATFIAGSGGAYSIVSGSLSGGDLVLSKADGTAITFDTSTSTLTGVAASVTESETTPGVIGEQFILTIDGLGAVDVTFGAGDTVATPAIAAELDSDLATFIAGSGGAYSIVSGSLSGGDLVLSKADGTPITFDTSTSTLTFAAANVTETETTAGVLAAAPTDTAFTMSIDGTQFFTEAAAVGGTVTAAELDAALTLFVAGSGGAYTIDSGSIATGNLIMSKADGTAITMTIDSNFSNTPGAFSGNLVSGSNAGTGIYQIGQVVDPTSYVVETYSINFVTNGNGELAYNVFGSVSGQLVPPTPQNSITNAPTYVDGGTIEFNGIQTGFSGTPVVGDSFTVSPSTRQDMFSTVQNLVDAMEFKVSTPSETSDMFNAINKAIGEIDTAFDNVIRVRTNIGARLKTIEDQTLVNESFRIELTATLSSVRDLNISEAAVELQSRLISLEAAQTTYTRIQGLSLFDFL